MLFNSEIFLFIFLPIVLTGFYLIRMFKLRLELPFLAASSLIFYSWNEPKWLILIMFSITANYFISHWIYKNSSKYKLFFGVLFNVLLIGWFKYRYFVVSTFMDYISFSELIIPLAISFFTFQQISLLVDVYDRSAKPFSFLDHLFYVTFFPQLIAGPIVFAREMIPQMKAIKNKKFKFTSLNLFSLGVFVFFVGLFKKVFLADNIAPYVNFGFEEAIHSLTFIEAWALISSFALQLYFDFSGYSEMAVGLALLFGFRLPFNFNMPYKASSMIDFWKRWHITVTRFFMLYLYSPISLYLGRIFIFNNSSNVIFLLLLPILITFAVSGLWHGADWKFVYFGLINGVAIIINHLWNIFKFPKLPFLLGWLLTMMTVLISFVFFRAASTEQAIEMVLVMFNPTLIILPIWMNTVAELTGLGITNLVFFGTGTFTLRFIIILITLFILSLKIPNVADKDYKLKTNWYSASIVSILILASFSNLNNAVSFIYFQF